ncbi:MAG: hypothetical protein ACX930_08520 [Erythrobacter sp.]
MTDNSDLNGLWEGQFRYFASEDIGAWAFKARILVKDGDLSGLTIETDAMGQGEVKADIKGSVDGRNVTFTKRYQREGEAYSRVITYEGRLDAERRKLEGTWTHLEGSGPFEMTRQN